jgi:two-component system chemotaxis response regulator CheB
MPEMDGLTALKKIMEECPTPVIMLSSRTQVGAEATLQALDLGALDFVAKPSGNISLDLDKIRDELVLKTKTAAQSYKRVTRLGLFRQEIPREYVKSKVVSGPESPPAKIVAIGSSTGGPRALQTVLSRLPANIPAAIVVVQHMPAGFTKSLADRLDSFCQLSVSEAADGDELLAGRVVIAPGGRHLRINRIGERFYVSLNDDPPVGGLRPTVDQMMESLADCDVPLLGVLLTGMGSDGVKGLKKIRAVKGYSIVEDESTCVVYGMPRAAIENNCVDRVAPLQRISQEILDLL